MKKFIDASGWVLLFAVILFSFTACNSGDEEDFTSNSVSITKLQPSTKIDLTNRGKDTSKVIVVINGKLPSIITTTQYDTIYQSNLISGSVQDLFDNGIDTTHTSVIKPPIEY